MKKLVALLFVFALSVVALSLQAQTGARPGSTPDLSGPSSPEGPGGSQGFDDITLLGPLGYILTNQSNPVGATNWFQGNDGVFSAQAGPSTSYAGANFNNAGISPGYVCNWMILPDLGDLASVTFWTRTVTGNTFPDRLRVRYSPSGGTSTGNCSGGYGDFTTELLAINPSLNLGGYPQSWTEFTVNPGGPGRVAIIYDVSGGGPLGNNSNYIGIDTLSYEVNVVPDHARFLVSKNFDDGNDAEVEVTLTCNTGLPLMQHWDISEGDPVNFVVGDFEQGTLDCEVTEAGVGGYTAGYYDGSFSGSECSWEDLEGGQYFCEITNSLDQVEVEVSKVWIDENPEFNAQNVAEAYWSCSNVAWGTSGGYLQFFGNPGEDSFWVYPDWESGTTCSITEVELLESGIEVDDSDCQGMHLWPDVGDTCTIYNTRLYEGIPTLSQYGLALLAMLMLGLGFVAYRRIV